LDPVEDFVDADGSLDYTPGEAIYRDLDGSGDVSPGDVRLTPVGAGVVNAVSPGAFALLERIIVTDNAIGPTFVPLLVEQVCVAMTAGSTIRASEILELRLYRENGVSAGFAGFGPGADDLLGRIPNPTLATLGDTCFGTPGQLLFSVNGINNTASETLYIVAAFAPWAQRGDSLRLTVEMRANDDLAGSGAGQSSRFTNGGSVLVIPSPNSTVISGPAAGALFVIDETDSLIGTAAPGSTVVLQQFSLENQTANLVTIDRITAYATGTPDDSVLANVKRIRLFRERGSTGPGWQEGDELLGTVTRPDLVNGARFGGNRRNLFTIQPNSVQRFYLVIDLDSGTPDGIGIQGAVEVSASSGAMPTDKIVLAAGSLEVEAPAATITVGDVTLSSRGKAKVSVANVPSPGLGTIHGVISFDPEIIQVVSTAQGTYRVRGLGNYLVDDLTVDNNAGTIEFLLILKPGRKPLTGSGDIMEIEFESAPDVNPGDSSPLDVEITDALDASANDLIFNEVSGTARIRIIMGDVDGNGVVTRRDATLLGALADGPSRAHPHSEEGRRRGSLLSIEHRLGGVGAGGLRGRDRRAMDQRSRGWPAHAQIERELPGAWPRADGLDAALRRAGAARAERGAPELAGLWTLRADGLQRGVSDGDAALCGRLLQGPALGQGRLSVCRNALWARRLSLAQ
jgi:hypothetical protein